jgi:hypothetical protein
MSEEYIITKGGSRIPESAWFWPNPVTKESDRSDSIDSKCDLSTDELACASGPVAYAAHSVVGRLKRAYLRLSYGFSAKKDVETAVRAVKAYAE